jgi:CRP/FNR family cyclic AMP-dependent transcriptional regulator
MHERRPPTQHSMSSLRHVVREAPFGSLLSEAELARIERDLRPHDVAAGAHVAWRGDEAANWVVVIDGMLKVEATAADGRRTTLIGITRAGWLGEAALLGDGRWPYDVIATRASVLGLLPRATFDELLASSLPFNRVLLGQLNARLRQFAARCEHVRLNSTREHVAYCLAELYDPWLYPGTGRRLPLSQDEVAHLAGVSRPTAHRVLHDLETQGLLSVAYGTITVHDPSALQRQAQRSRAPVAHGCALKVTAQCR